MTVTSGRYWALAGLAAAVAAFGTALISQYVFDMRPCPLCVWQRYPYGVGIAVAVLGLLLVSRGAAAQSLWSLAAIVFVVGAGLGVFHSGVEFGWWEGLSSCAGGGAAGGGLMSAEALLEELRTAPTVGCADRVPFFLGLTMANWNVFASLAMAGCFALAVLRGARSVSTATA